MKDVEDIKDDLSSRGSRMGASDRPAETSGRPPASPTCPSAQTLRFPLCWSPTELFSPLSEISDKVPTICHNVGFSYEISMVGAILCSRLQPEPHCGRGTVRNHPTDHPSCISPLYLFGLKTLHLVKERARCRITTLINCEKRFRRNGL